MYYQMDEYQFTQIAYQEINPDQLTIGFITIEELSKIYEEMGFDYDTYEQCITKTSTLQNPPLIHNDYIFGLLHILSITNIQKPHDKFAFYLLKNSLFIIDLYSSNQTVLHALQFTLDRITDTTKITLPQLFTNFLTNFIYHDSQALELLELQLEDLEKKVMSPEMGNVRSDLFHYRRKLLVIRNYYEQFINISEEIYNNTNQLFDSKQLVPIRLFQSRVRRLCDHTKDLTEYVSQIKESYMAQLDINLNSIMKVFTIVTTIFMPLTLIVGWYGMNFKYMPELRWRYGYPSVIVLSIATLIISLYWFKKKHFF